MLFKYKICYRVFMQLCSVYKFPTLAIRTLLHMRKYKIDINHITYSYYNKAIIEGDWPTSDRWGKLRLYIQIIKAFKNSLKERQERLAKLDKNKIKLNGKENKSNKNKTRKAGYKKTAKSNSNQTIKPNINNVCEECSNKTSTATLEFTATTNDQHQLCSSRSQSITCSLSSIADNQDKASVDKVSRESGDSGDNDQRNLIKTNRILKNKTKDLAQIKKNRQLFDSKMKAKTSIVKKQLSCHTSQNETNSFSNAIHCKSSFFPFHSKSNVFSHLSNVNWHSVNK